eukprot:Gb_06340 [translate_table: standard]
MYYHPKRLPANEDRIYKQRQYEEALRARKESVHEYEHLMRCAEFEHSNEPKMNNRSLSERLKSIRAQREAKLEERRKKLAELLETENSMLELEMKTSSMNLAERRAWLEERARTLKMQRLQRNQQYAAQQLDRAFRENCDDVRIHNSKMAVLKAEEERKKQREMNLQRKLHEQEEEKAFDKMMVQEWQRQDELYRKEEEQEHARNEEAYDILRRQYNLVQRLREEERQAVEEDMREMKRRWQEEEDSLKQFQYQQRQMEIQNSRELEDYNDRCRAQKQDEYRQEKEYDARMSLLIAEMEAADELQEKKLKENQKREAREYAAQLKDALDRQKSDDAELEAMINSELDQEWRRKDAHNYEQELVRKGLYDQVDEQRKAQIRLKDAQNWRPIGNVRSMLSCGRSIEARFQTQGVDKFPQNRFLKFLLGLSCWHVFLEDKIWIFAFRVGGGMQREQFFSPYLESRGFLVLFCGIGEDEIAVPDGANKPKAM